MRTKSLISVISFITICLFIFSNSLLAQDTVSVTKSKEIQEYYKIGASDVLYIFVWKEPDLTLDLTVMPDGRIIFPLIGEVMAKGRSAIELKDIITKKLKDYISSPEVTVLVRQSNSRRIYTIGKINSPGPYPLEAGMTVLQALSVAGGFTEWADSKNIRIVRRLKGKEAMFGFNYQDFIAGKNLGQNLLLEPGDTIVIP
ncbi:MAG: polysaccharide biosynthesis/export family protein [Desulfobacteraceae bacterium]|jgi:polysaccharide export outer membrane protein